jgi:hypothetical protein
LFSPRSVLSLNLGTNLRHIRTVDEDRALRREWEWEWAVEERWQKEEGIGGVLQVAGLPAVEATGRDAEGESVAVLDITDTISECVVPSIWFWGWADWHDIENLKRYLRLMNR